LAVRHIKAFLRLWKNTFAEWSRDGASRFATALALYTLLSLGPLLLLIVSVAGLIVGRNAAESEIVKAAQRGVGTRGAQAIQNVLENASQPGRGVSGTIIGFVILIFGLTGLFLQIQTALDTIWGIEPKPHQGIMGQLRHGLASIGFLAGMLFLLFVVLVVTTGVTALVGGVTGGTIGVAVQILNVIVSLLVFTLIFALIYKVIPEGNMRWRDCFVGAAVTAVLFTIGRTGIGIYLAHSKTSSYYGTAGSLVVLVIWIYYSAQIFFIGAEFSQVYASRHGRAITPDKRARAIP
jgi:membrane protein